MGPRHYEAKSGTYWHTSLEVVVLRSNQLEGTKLRTLLTTVLVATILVALEGCGAVGEKAAPIAGKELFTVDFQKGQSLRYEFASTRNIAVQWDPKKIDRSTESMNMVIAYTPAKVDPYGLSTIRAKCESVSVRRTKEPGKDAVESLAGQTFTFTVDPTGRIEDYSDLDRLVFAIGKKAFRPNTKGRRVKEPDMIDDFIATQWFLWDAVSSIENPIKGVSLGQSWKSQLSVPTSMVLKQARDVTYTLDEIRETEKGRVAVIRSSYRLPKAVTRDWPIPYSGSFQMSGMLGFLRMFSRGFNFLELQGQGEELYNLDAGRIEQYNQKYTVQLETSRLPLPGAKPRLTIEQSLTMRLLKD